MKLITTPRLKQNNGRNKRLRITSCSTAELHPRRNGWIRTNDLPISIGSNRCLRHAKI